MADYVGLPPVPKTASADTTGKNPGNYSVTFAAGDIVSTVPIFEIPRIVVVGGLLLAEIQVYVGNQWFDAATVGFNGLTVWSARNPMILNSGTEVSLLFTIPVTGNTPPQVTLWPRYDAALPINRLNADLMS